MNKQRLELTWVNKDQRPKLEPRVLVQDTSMSQHSNLRRAYDLFDNRLIFGDNLLGLKALEQELTSKVKCIFIDPPYNTGSAFTHYEDNLEHSIWLSLVRDRLEILRRLLSDDGSIWVSIDDNEGAYLKVLMDEIFGRLNFRASVTWQKKYSVSNNFKGIASITDWILVYSKSDKFQNNLLPRTQESIDRYSNPDNDSRGPWKAVDYLNQATPEKRRNLCYEIVNPNTGEILRNTKKAWKYEPSVYQEHVDQKKLWWGLDGKNKVPALKLFLSEVRDGMTPHNWWPHEDVGHTDESKKEIIHLFGDENVFDTPKPERLIKRVLEIASAPGDIVLDSFAGSGTTGAVAHKMGRRWIMIEMGEHCHTHIIPRLKKVIDGTDQGGISKAVGWKGGGGFRYYRLAPSLIKKDQWGNEVINPQFNPEMVAEAVCKLEGFTYAPSDTEFWRHGQSTENDFIYVTTQTLTAEQLDRISEDVGPERSLLVCCGAWRAKETRRWPNLSLKKIPKTVLDKADWDHDDYALAVKELPVVEDDEDALEDVGTKAEGAKKKAAGQGDLFTAKTPPAGIPKKRK